MLCSVPLHCSCPWDGAGLGNPTSQPDILAMAAPMPSMGQSLAPCRPTSPTEQWTSVHACSDVCVCRGAQEASVEQ